MQGLGITVAYAVAALFGLYMYALQSWWSVPRVILLGFLLASLPGVILAVVVTPDLKRAPTAKALMPLLLVATLIGAGGSALWALPAVRVKAASLFAQEIALLNAVDDPDEGVKLAACGKMLQDKLPPNVIFGVLRTRPMLAERCLALPIEYTNRVDLESRLMRDWHYTLRAGVMDEAKEMNACAMAQSMGRFGEASKGVASLKLLSCVVSSPSPARQMCCSSALKQLGADGKSLMAMMIRMQDEAIAHGVAGPLVATSYGEKQTVAKLGKYIGELGLNSPALKPISAKLACESYLGGEYTNQILPYLNWLLPRFDGCLDESERARVDDLATSELCYEISGGILGADDPEEFICRSKKRAIMQMKANEERLAQRNSEAMAKLSGSIEAGHSRRGRDMMDMEGFLKNIDEQRRTAELGGSVMPTGTDMSDAEKAMFIDAMTRQAQGLMRSEAELAKMKRDANKMVDSMSETNPQFKEMFELKLRKDGSLNAAQKARLLELEKAAEARESKATKAERIQFGLDKE